MNCPQCNGKGGSPCHINTGLDSSQHRWEWVSCTMCHGEGSIDGDLWAKWLKGRELRKERAERGETLYEMAKRTGKSPAQISAEEWGR